MQTPANFHVSNILPVTTLRTIDLAGKKNSSLLFSIFCGEMRVFLEVNSAPQSVHEVGADESPPQAEPGRGHPLDSNEYDNPRHSQGAPMLGWCRKNAPELNESSGVGKTGGRREDYFWQHRTHNISARATWINDGRADRCSPTNAKQQPSRKLGVPGTAGGPCPARAWARSFSREGNQAARFQQAQAGRYS